MDAKYLAEIKARCEAVDSARRGEGGKSFGISCWKLKENALADIPALLAEVERLTVENGVLRSECRAHIQKQADLFKGYQQIKADNAAKDQQIATLKRTLEIANITIQKLSGENYEYSTSSFQAQEQEEKS